MSEHTSPIHTFYRNFLRCGLIGWCTEIIFTAMCSLRRRNMRLPGYTSLWMFPIYGSVAFLKPLFQLLKNCSVWLRGIIYMTVIFCAEFFTGSLLERRHLCPWDYGNSRYHINRLIRLDYAPLWFCIGLLFEQVLAHRETANSPSR